MITVFGAEGAEQRRDAELLKELATEWAPAIAKSVSTHIDIYCNLTTPGVEIRDVDILVSMWSSTDACFPEIVCRGQTVRFENMVGIMEVKSHRPRGVRFLGPSVTVMYKEGPESLTEKLKRNHGPFREYLVNRNVPDDPRVGSVGWLRGFPRACTPDGFDNPQIVFADLTFVDLLSAFTTSGIRRRRVAGSRWTCSSVDGNGSHLGQELRRLFGEVLPPKRIGRSKLEAVFQSWFKEQAYVKDVGRKMFLVKGAAGTGKTVVLLRMTRDLIRDYGATVVFASYNQALLSDLRGQMALWRQTDFDDFIAEQRLRLESVHSLVSSIARLLGVRATGSRASAPLSERNEWLASIIKTLDEIGPEARDYLAALWPNEFSSQLESTFIAIDEAQDILPLERDLLLRVFGHERLLVAFSDYQVSRVGKPTRWERTDRAEQQEIRLRKVWRSFSLLTEFTKQFAQAQAVASDDERLVAREFTGGRIIIVEGSYFGAEGLHRQLLSELTSDGNAPMDMLVLVPPGDGSATTEEGSAHHHLIGNGSAVWNGTDSSVRRQPQTSRQEIRLLNYQSGRGLEAWTVVALGLDEYYAWLMRERPGFEITPSLFAADTELAAQRQAIRRMMMPLTRAINTLVLEVRDPESDFAQFLEPVLHEFADEIERVRAPIPTLPQQAVAGTSISSGSPAPEPTAGSLSATPSSDTSLPANVASVRVGVAAPTGFTMLPEGKNQGEVPIRGPSVTLEGRPSVVSVAATAVYEGVSYRYRGARWADKSGLTPPLAIVQHLNFAYERAVAEHDEALTSADELTAIAKEAMAAGQLSRALRCARRALELTPGHEGRAAALVAVMRKARRYDEALDVLRTFQGTVYEPLVTTGAALLCDLERWDHAHKVLQRVCARGRVSAEALAVKRRIEAARPDLANVY